MKVAVGIYVSAFAQPNFNPIQAEWQCNRAHQWNTRETRAKPLKTLKLEAVFGTPMTLSISLTNLVNGLTSK
jgi:hypothetical protein